MSLSDRVAARYIKSFEPDHILADINSDVDLNGEEQERVKAILAHLGVAVKKVLEDAGMELTAKRVHAIYWGREDVELGVEYEAALSGTDTHSASLKGFQTEEVRSAELQEILRTKLKQTFLNIFMGVPDVLVEYTRTGTDDEEVSVVVDMSLKLNMDFEG